MYSLCIYKLIYYAHTYALYINSYRYAHLTFDKRVKICLKKSNSRNSASWQNWTSTYGRREIDPYFSPCTKVNPTWTKCLNLTPEMLRQLQKSMLKTFQNTDNGILPEIATAVGKWGYMKVKGLCSVKETISRANRQQRKQWKNLSSYTSEKGLTQRIF